MLRTGLIVTRDPREGGVSGSNGNFGSSANITQMFTGQERDGGTATLDYFNARHMSAVLGWFTQSDPMNAGASITNPQLWNAYAYVGNNPLNATDPSGMMLIAPDFWDDPIGGCDDDPFCGGGDWEIPIVPPIIIGGGGGGGGRRGGGSSGGSPSGSVPLPPGSFPGGETAGLPAGLSVPGAIGTGTNSFLDPTGVGALAADACITNPLCFATAGALGLGGYLVYKLSPPGPLTVPSGWNYATPKVIFQSPITLMGRSSRQSGKVQASDVADWASNYPKKGPQESCAAFAARILVEQYGLEHPNATRRGPGSEYSKIKKACERGGL